MFQLCELSFKTDVRTYRFPFIVFFDVTFTLTSVRSWLFHK